MLSLLDTCLHQKKRFSQFFTSSTEVSADQKNRTHHRWDTALYFAALANKARNISGLHRLTIKKTQCPLPILESLRSLRTSTYSSHRSLNSVYRLLLTSACRQSKQFERRRPAPLFHTSWFPPIPRISAQWLLSSSLSHSASWFALQRLHTYSTSALAIRLPTTQEVQKKLCQLNRTSAPSLIADRKSMCTVVFFVLHRT